MGVLQLVASRCMATLKGSFVGFRFHNSAYLLVKKLSLFQIMAEEIAPEYDVVVLGTGLTECVLSG